MPESRRKFLAGAAAMLVAPLVPAEPVLRGGCFRSKTLNLTYGGYTFDGKRTAITTGYHFDGVTVSWWIKGEKV